MIKNLQETSEPFGLKINKDKTKVMSNTTDQEYKVEDWSIEKVDEFTYLGQKISFNNKMTKEIDARISAAWRSFWAMEKFFLSDLPMYYKRRLLDSVILPIFTYGAQTWNLTASDERKIQAEKKAMKYEASLKSKTFSQKPKS